MTPEMKGIYSQVRLNSEISRKDYAAAGADVVRKPCGSQSGASLPLAVITRLLKP